jgi:hypothetical protein
MRRPNGVFFRSAFACGLLLGSLLAQGHPASADQMLALVRITCVPEAGYFSIRRLVFANPPQEQGDGYRRLLATVESKDRMYTASRLKAEPAECELLGTSDAPASDPRRLRVHVRGFHDNQSGQAAGPRQIVEEVEVSAGGKPLGRLLLNALGYLPDEVDLMEVRFDGGSFWVDKCSYHPSVDPVAKKGCTRETF